MHDQAKSESQAIIARATEEAMQVRAELATLRTTADERMRDIDRLDADFNRVLADTIKRLGLEQPASGWWKRK